MDSQFTTSKVGEPVLQKSNNPQQKADPLKVGIIGLGKMGRIRLKCAEEHPDLLVCSICDTNTQLANNFPGYRYYSDFRELTKDDLDVVFVCAYNYISPEAVISSLNNGKHVFCEKPPGRSVEDVARIIETEFSNPGLKLKFGFNHRYHYAVMEAKSMVDSGLFGDVLWMRGIYGKCGGIQFKNSWRNDSNIAGGGILLDQGIHMLDLLRYFCGEFEDIQSFVTTSFWDIPVEDNAFAILRNDKNQVALLHSSATQWKHRFTLEICLADGYININGMLTSTRSYGDESLTFARRQFEDESFAFGRPREETVFFDRDDSWKLEVDEFVKAIRDGTKIQNGSSQDALRSMQMVEQIYQKGQR